jgi:hypothetical protein
MIPVYIIEDIKLAHDLSKNSQPFHRHFSSKKLGVSHLYLDRSSWNLILLVSDLFWTRDY